MSHPKIKWSTNARSNILHIWDWQVILCYVTSEEYKCRVIIVSVIILFNRFSSKWTIERFWRSFHFLLMNYIKLLKVDFLTGKRLILFHSTALLLSLQIFHFSLIRSTIRFFQLRSKIRCQTLNRSNPGK
jgi:hypothetical protein